MTVPVVGLAIRVLDLKALKNWAPVGLEKEPNLKIIRKAIKNGQSIPFFNSLEVLGHHNRKK